MINCCVCGEKFTYMDIIEGSPTPVAVDDLERRTDDYSTAGCCGDCEEVYRELTWENYKRGKRNNYGKIWKEVKERSI